jgi:hypothetical protein
VRGPPAEAIVAEMLEVIHEDTHALEIFKRGSSDDKRIIVYRKARDEGASRSRALRGTAA